MSSQAVSRCGTGRAHSRESEIATHRRVQPIGGDQPAPADTGRIDSGIVLPNTAHCGAQGVHAGVATGGGQRIVQCSPPDAASGAVPETARHLVVPADVPDPDERQPGDCDRQERELVEGGRHQPLAARLVDRGGPRFHHHDAQTRRARVQCRGETDRAASGHDQVDVGSAHPLASDRDRRARFSVAIRVRSRAASAIVNTNAVTHAPCTRGNASPSTATAT